ncbi:MAG: penicillin-binding protein 1C [Saprospiraceae bacterium]|nr:penicillin-binding protein 1C [Saprospiraceae bacterium]
MRILSWIVCSAFIVWFASMVYAPYLIRDLKFSPVLYSNDHTLLAAKVSADGQWRFPVTSDIPENYKIALKVFEDQRFDWHVGFDPVSIFRAAVLNIENGKVVSGGSTISMQLVRLLMRNPPRTFFNKLKEFWLAIGLEFNFNKDEILKYYSGVAPYGGNVVGVQAAIWRYFQRAHLQMSWAEAALFAVLPNQPSYIHLKKNRALLLKKRNALLEKLYYKHFIEKEILELSLLEPIPDQIFSMPQLSQLLLERLIKMYPGQFQFESTMDPIIQDKFIKIANQYARNFRQNEIHNLAILLVDNNTQEVNGYIANAIDTAASLKNQSVNNIHSPRSSGSILKPLLYACSLDRGIVTPELLMPDVPTLIAGFRPENFSRTYAGAVPLNKCLQQSLNVPAARLLRQFGVAAFYQRLQQLGFSNLFRPAEDYGLSLILGGAEVSCWDLAKIYADLAFQLNSFNNGIKSIQDPFKLKLLKQELPSKERARDPFRISVASIYEMFSALQGAQLPDEFSTVFYEMNKHRIAWKTGTSFGFKDAWCVGVTPDYTMVVWVGNSTGVGRPGLIGVHTAAPMLFELFQSLNYTADWKKPVGEMYPQMLCKQSGHPINKYCSDSISILHPSKNLDIPLCPYHQKIFTDVDKKFRVYRDCEINSISATYFNLPAVLEFYYKPHHGDYQSIPPLRKDCVEYGGNKGSVIEFIYPDKGTEVFIPIDLDELSNKMVLKAAHKDGFAVVHWFMDDQYLGSTTNGNHEWAVLPQAGTHQFLIVDENGASASAKIQCYRR